ncbi:hypothetical protein BDN72DRAFT_842233 [Pluteus cervinus]|uniref:Uncharacterized protein n=1 Tax=Pluteus cervinus TaxID=181527 RepID=A0ACD3AQ95_9AGAR|nr:hypothetical protein BDN72DRAFT_842233 [Pluteus cervinus]
MSPLGTKVKEFLAKPRLAKGPLLGGLIPLTNLNGGHESKHDEAVQIPRHITDGLPQELYECILYFVQDNKQTLQACSVVCRAWRHVCDKWLFTQPLRPFCLTSQSGFKFKEPLRSVAIHDPTQAVLYGTARGIYFRDMTDLKAAPCMVHRMSDICQLDIVDRPSTHGGPLVIWRSARRIYMAPLKHLDGSTPAVLDSKAPQPIRWEGNCDLYSIGNLTGLLFLAAINSKDRILVRVDGNSFVRDRVATFTSNPVDVALAHDQVITVGFNTFKTMDFQTGTANVILPPAITPVVVNFGLRPVTASACIKDNKKYTLVCYTGFATFVNEARVAYGQPIVWSFLALTIVFQDDYIFILSQDHLEIRHMFKQDLKHVTSGKFRLLSGKQANRTVIIREDGYIFGFRAAKGDLQ